MHAHMLKSATGTFSRLYCLLIFLLALTASLGIGQAADSAGAALPRFLPAVPGSADVARPGALRFLTADDFPPFNFVDATGRLTGYNVELARAICARLSIPCTVQARPFPLLIQSLQENTGDAIIAGMADTPGLRTFVLYTEPYLRLPARFVMRKGQAFEATPEGLRGAAVAVPKGTRYESFLKDFFPDVKRLATNDLDGALALVRAGTARAVFGGALPASFWLAGPQGRDCCAFVGGAYTETAYFGKGMTIAVAKNNPALKRALDETLRGLEADGVLKDLYIKFFPVSLY